MQGLTRINGILRQVHNSEQGAEGLEKLLIIGAIVLPLLLFLIFFKDTLQEWLLGRWDEVDSDSTFSAP